MKNIKKLMLVALCATQTAFSSQNRYGEADLNNLVGLINMGSVEVMGQVNNELGKTPSKLRLCELKKPGSDYVKNKNEKQILLENQNPIQVFGANSDRAFREFEDAVNQFYAQEGIQGDRIAEELKNDLLLKLSIVSDLYEEDTFEQFTKNSNSIEAALWITNDVMSGAEKRGWLTFLGNPTLNQIKEVLEFSEYSRLQGLNGCDHAIYNDALQKFRNLAATLNNFQKINQNAFIMQPIMGAENQGLDEFKNNVMAQFLEIVNEYNNLNNLNNPNLESYKKAYDKLTEKTSVLETAYLLIENQLNYNQKVDVINLMKTINSGEMINKIRDFKTWQLYINSNFLNQNQFNQ